MLDIFSGLRLVVKRRTINIDNAIFRCHWFFTSTLLVSFSLIITARQYVGQPIECHSVDKIPDSLLNSYCWVQSTFTVPQACSAGARAWQVPYPCIDNTRGREVKVYAYYQWVGIVLFVQGLMFHLPYYLWKLWENGLIKAITGGLRVAVLNEQERVKKKEIVVEYIHDHLGCHKRYALKYFLCEFICLVNLLGQLWATNKFFDGQFLRYGLEVLEYSSASLLELNDAAHELPSDGGGGRHHRSKPTPSQQIVSSIGQGSSQSQPAQSSNEHYLHKQQVAQRGIELFAAENASSRRQPGQHFQQQQTQQQQVVDPMTYIFPRMTKCSYFDFGSSGDVQKHDALCLLPLNIINEKIYIALWFWFLVLALLTVLVIVYRLAAIASEAVRCKGLISRCKLSSERDIRLICRHCDVGDWFLFYMVAENLDPLIMREIIAAIASKIADQLELKRELKAQLQREEAERRHLQHKTEIEQQQQQQRQHYCTNNRPDAPEGPLELAVQTQSQPPRLTPAPSAPRASLCPSCSSSQLSSRRNSLADQQQTVVAMAEASASGAPQLVRKIKKRLYNKRLWSAELGPGELRQQLFGSPLGDHPANESQPSSERGAPATIFGYLALGPQSGPTVAAQSRCSSLFATSLTHRRCGSLTRKPFVGAGSATPPATSSGSFVMEMASIRASSPCLLDGVSLESGAPETEKRAGTGPRDSYNAADKE